MGATLEVPEIRGLTWVVLVEANISALEPSS